MKMCLGFFNKNVLYWVEKIKAVYSAFYLVYSAPVDPVPLPVERAKGEQVRNDFAEGKLLGRKRKIYSPILGGAFTIYKYFMKLLLYLLIPSLLTGRVQGEG